MAMAIFFGKATNKYYLLIGTILGFSFLFRFQIAFAILGFGLWLLVIHKVALKDLLKMGGSFVIVVILGIIIDSWFYETLVFTPWQYFNVNILQGAAAGFGTQPWYYYLTSIIDYSGYPIGIIILLSIGIVAIKQPKNILIWIILPFLILHSCIDHKEFRFLFPLSYLIPMVLFIAYDITIKSINTNRFFKILIYAFGFVLFVFNTIGLIVMSQNSAGYGQMDITKYIHDTYENEPTNLVFCTWANPYNPWQSVPSKFYEEKNMTSHQIGNLCELNDSLFSDSKKNILIARKINIKNKNCRNQLERYNFRKVRQSIPEWVEEIGPLYPIFNTNNILVLYER